MTSSVQPSSRELTLPSSSTFKSGEAPLVGNASGETHEVSDGTYGGGRLTSEAGGVSVVDGGVCVAPQMPLICRQMFLVRHLRFLYLSLDSCSCVIPCRIKELRNDTSTGMSAYHFQMLVCSLRFRRPSAFSSLLPYPSPLRVSSLFSSPHPPALPCLSDVPWHRQREVLAAETVQRGLSDRAVLVRCAPQALSDAWSISEVRGSKGEGGREGGKEGGRLPVLVCLFVGITHNALSESGHSDSSSAFHLRSCRRLKRMYFWLIVYSAL